MRIFTVRKRSRMTEPERKRWRSKMMDRLQACGIPFRDLAGKTDHEIWQMKNRTVPKGKRSTGIPSIIEKPRSLG